MTTLTPKLVIIGGKLQGTEVCLLSTEAGFEVTLIDADPDTPAKNLCSRFINTDLIAEVKSGNGRIEEIFKSADLIIPTMENYGLLEFIVELCDELGINDKLAFDWDAYKISYSKIISDKLFHDNALPAPRYYPEGDFPYFVKPSNDSGSHGVRILRTMEDMAAFNKERPKDTEYIIQEYLEGPSYSVEVIGRPGNYKTYEITDILVDDEYDCYSVVTPENLDKAIDAEIRKIAVDIAELISLKGIMDLEVIVTAAGQIRILEIDARFPSQTPLVVYRASGVNLVEELYNLYKKQIQGNECHTTESENHKHAKLIHYMIENGSYRTLGEHIMVEGGALGYTEGITKEATVISDYEPGRKKWRSVFIFSAATVKELENKAARIEDDLGSFLKEKDVAVILGK